MIRIVQTCYLGLNIVRQRGHFSRHRFNAPTRSIGVAWELTHFLKNKAKTNLTGCATKIAAITLTAKIQLFLCTQAKAKSHGHWLVQYGDEEEKAPRICKALINEHNFLAHYSETNMILTGPKITDMQKHLKAFKKINKVLSSRKHKKENGEEGLCSRRRLGFSTRLDIMRVANQHIQNPSRRIGS